MDEHETSLQAKRGSISADSNIDAQKAMVAGNFFGCENSSSWAAM